MTELYETESFVGAVLRMPCPCTSLEPETSGIAQRRPQVDNVDRDTAGTFRSLLDEKAIGNNQIQPNSLPSVLLYLPTGTSSLLHFNS
jgi:hypothetical protein